MKKVFKVAIFALLLTVLIGSFNVKNLADDPGTGRPTDPNSVNPILISEDPGTGRPTNPNSVDPKA